MLDLASYINYSIFHELISFIKKKLKKKTLKIAYVNDLTVNNTIKLIWLTMAVLTRGIFRRVNYPQIVLTLAL